MFTPTFKRCFEMLHVEKSVSYFLISKDSMHFTLNLVIFQLNLRNVLYITILIMCFLQFQFKIHRQQKIRSIFWKMLQLRRTQKWRDLQCLCFIGQKIHQITRRVNPTLEPCSGRPKWAGYQIYGQIKKTKRFSQQLKRRDWNARKDQQKTFLQKKK